MPSIEEFDRCRMNKEAIDEGDWREREVVV